LPTSSSFNISCDYARMENRLGYLQGWAWVL
jgi:hypothetical protein